MTDEPDNARAATEINEGFAAVDVHYFADGSARAAVVVYEEERFAQHRIDRVEKLAAAAPYRPGAFFERELPALRLVLAGTAPSLLVIDGYVDLDPSGRPGLGARVRDELNVPVIGVAKTAFRPAIHAVRVTRGLASRPLYVTAAGIDRATAAALVAAMAGPYRLPDALRRVDTLARNGVTPLRPP